MPSARCRPAACSLPRPLSERFSVGVGVLSYFGLAQEYDDDWVGRYYLQKGDLLGLSVMPAASFKATDWLSIGAGLNAMYGYLDTEVAVRTLRPTDGQLELSDETWGFGANVGRAVYPGRRLAPGRDLPLAVDLDFQDRPSFSNLGPLGGAIFANPPQLDLGVTVPQSVMVQPLPRVEPEMGAPGQRRLAELESVWKSGMSAWTRPIPPA